MDQLHPLLTYLLRHHHQAKSNQLKYQHNSLSLHASSSWLTCYYVTINLESSLRVCCSYANSRTSNTQFSCTFQFTPGMSWVRSSCFSEQSIPCSNILPYSKSNPYNKNYCDDKIILFFHKHIIIYLFNQ